MATDQRKPELVREEFRRRIADLLAPIGFAPRAKGDLVRRHGKNRHRVEFSSSQRNTDGHVVCWEHFGFDDGEVRARHPGWTAGGSIHGHAFAGNLPDANIADSDEADAN